MRLRVSLDDEFVREIDERFGVERRSSFIAAAARRALDDERRWELMESSIGSIPDPGHDWDDDPAAWVRAQRRGDPRRVG